MRTATAVLLASGALPAIAHACSKTPVTVQRFAKSSLSFIGTAKSDTVQAGPGDVQYVVEPGHFGPARNRVVYGQRVSVERVAEYARAMLPSGVREVVLIPWDYDAACRPTPWARSAKWMEPEVRGVYTATLRAESHWINGMPTLDVFSPEFVPYLPSKPHRLDGEAPALSIEELLDVASRVPDPEEMNRDPESASGPFLEWAKAHPELSKRSPAAGLAWDAVYAVYTVLLKRTRVDIAGTWKFTATVDGEPSRVFYARTHERPTTQWYDDSPAAVTARGKRQPWEMLRIDGYTVIAAVSSSLEKLYAGCANMTVSGYMSQRVPGVQGSTPNRIVGDLELSLINGAFRGDTTFVAYKSVSPETAADSVAFAARGNGVLFETGSDEVMRVAQTWWLGAGRVLVVRGERVSGEVGKCAW